MGPLTFMLISGAATATRAMSDAVRTSKQRTKNMVDTNEQYNLMIHDIREVNDRRANNTGSDVDRSEEQRLDEQRRKTIESM